MQGEGWIKLYWKTKESLVGSNIIALGLWSHILLSVSRKDRILHNGELLKAGECIISAAQLAKDANLCKKTVQRYLQTFETSGAISVVKKSRNGTHLSVCNWRTYQEDLSGGVAKKSRNEPATSPQRHRNAPQTENPKKGKKRESGDRARPADVNEVRRYCEERGNGVNPERFFDHYEANGWVQGRGKPVKDWKACVRTWEQNGVNVQPKQADPTDSSWETFQRIARGEADA